MTNKKEFGQFFSKNEELVEAFIHHIAPEDILIDPFAGDMDLLKHFDNVNESYDLFPLHESTVQNDSLLNPPNFKGKFVITNPPYLNVNKTENKDIFEIYDTDDLYKASLKTIIATADKGIIIIPSAFWFNERTASMRKEFLSAFRVDEVVVFNKQMFADTTYTVCSFYYERDDSPVERDVHFTFLGKNAGEATLKYSALNEYSIIKDAEKGLLKTPKGIKIGRYTNFTQTTTNIFLNCLDSTERIYAEIKEPYMGINTDRAFLTFTLTGAELTSEEEILMVDMFNKELENMRMMYSDGFLSNFRNAGRKRIGFTFAYKLFGHCLVKIKKL